MKLSDKEFKDKLILVALKSPNKDVMDALNTARQLVNNQSGTSMYMTLPNGTHIVRFLVPQVSLPNGGSKGNYSEGINEDLQLALFDAISGLM